MAPLFPLRNGAPRPPKNWERWSWSHFSLVEMVDPPTLSKLEQRLWRWSLLLSQLEGADGGDGGGGAPALSPSSVPSELEKQREGWRWPPLVIFNKI